VEKRKANDEPTDPETPRKFSTPVCVISVYICLWMYWITQHCDYDVRVLCFIQ
jgi:hypothetical protein